MGMLGKDNKFYSNPNVARRKDAEMPEPDSPEQEGGGEVHAVTIHKRRDGRHHVVAHHGEGSSASDHDTLDEAMDHARAHLDDDQGEPEGQDGSEMEQEIE